MSVSDPSDRFEVEAATNAEKVMSQPAPRTGAGAALRRSSGTTPTRHVRPARRQREGEEEEEAQASHDPSLGPVQREEEEEEEPA